MKTRLSAIGMLAVHAASLLSITALAPPEPKRGKDELTRNRFKPPRKAKAARENKRHLLKGCRP